MTEPRTIPATELYWGVIDTSGFLPIPFQGLRPQAVRRRLANQFDAVLPLPVESLHAVYRPIGEARYLACGIEHDRIAALHAKGISGLVPDSIPEAVSGKNSARIDPDSLDLLTGPYTPHALMQRRQRRTRVAAIAVLVIAALITAGNLRRAAVYRSHAADRRDQQTTLYADALGPLTGGTPPAIRLTTELRRLSQTRGDAAESPDRARAPRDLADLLRAWPVDAELRIERLSVDGDRIDITGEAADAETVRDLITALGELDGWAIPVKRVDQSRDGQTARARLGLERTNPPEGRS